MRNETRREKKKKQNRDKTRQSFMLHKQVQGKVKKLFTELKTRNTERENARRISATVRCLKRNFRLGDFNFLRTVPLLAIVFCAARFERQNSQ